MSRQCSRNGCDRPAVHLILWDRYPSGGPSQVETVACLEHAVWWGTDQFDVTAEPL